LAKNLQKKYKIIISREIMFAKSVAFSVIRPEPLSVWDVTLPIVFILNYMKHKQAREIFKKNFLFTKELALKASMKIVKERKDRKEIIIDVKDKTNELLSSDTLGIYSEEIRNCQINEIEILIDHFSLLLDNEGDNYYSLVKRSYQSRENYEKFTVKLTNAEKQVLQAARQTLGDQANTIMADKMETAIEKARKVETEKIFNS